MTARWSAVPYRVRRGSEECECPRCGEPTYTGETAYALRAPDGDEVEAGLCSLECASRAAEEQQ